MTTNEGSLDRATRMVLGIAMPALGFSGVVRGPAGVALIVIGTLLFVTGVTGRCLLYKWLSWSTMPRQPHPGR